MANKKTSSSRTTAKKNTPARKKAPATAKKAASKSRSQSKKRARVVAKAPADKDNFIKIQETAYLLAEKDNFRGDPTAYWLEAQKKFGGA